MYITVKLAAGTLHHKSSLADVNLQVISASVVHAVALICSAGVLQYIAKMGRVLISDKYHGSY